MLLFKDQKKKYLFSYIKKMAKTKTSKRTTTKTVETSSGTPRKSGGKRASSSRPAWVLPVLGFLALALIIALVVYLATKDKKKDNESGGTSAPSAQGAFCKINGACINSSLEPPGDILGANVIAPLLENLEGVTVRDESGIPVLTVDAGLGEAEVLELLLDLDLGSQDILILGLLGLDILQLPGLNPPASGTQEFALQLVGAPAGTQLAPGADFLLTNPGTSGPGAPNTILVRKDFFPDGTCPTGACAI